MSNSKTTTMRTGGQVLVDQLALHGVELAFCVPGESYLAVLDALHDAPIRLVTCRHEAAAANMAEAHGKLTGEPGICLVTRGPGATHAAIGVHTAYQDSTPLILLIGQVGRDMQDREAFQEIDYRRMFNPMAKWVAQIESAARIPELVARAFSVATAGRPGPVVLALPEDMLVDEVEVADARAYERVRTHPGRAELEQLRALLEQAERPLAIAGGGGWSAAAARDLLAFCEASEIPVGTSFRCQDYVDNRSRVHAGHVGVGIDPKLAQRVADADLLLVVGSRLGEMTTGGYTLVEPPLPRQTLVHVHAGRRGARSRVPADASDPRRLARVRRGRDRRLCCCNTKSCSPRLGRGRARGLPRHARARLAARFAQPERGHEDAPRAATGRRNPDERRRQLRGLGAPLLPLPRLPQPARADERGDGLRPARGDRGEDRGAAAGRRLHRRRRRLPDERPGASDRGARGRRGDRARRRQRHVRDDPDAPGARIPRSRRRHVAHESGLRRVRPLVRRAWGDGRAHRGVRAGARGGARGGPAGAPPPARRPGGDHSAGNA